MNFQIAEEVQDIAKQLITTDEALKEVKEFEPQIKYLFSNAKVTKNNCTKIAVLKKATGVWKGITGLNFVLIVNQNIFANLSEESKIAVINTELFSIKLKKDKNDEIKLDDNDEMIWDIQKKNIETFSEMIDKYPNYLEKIQATVNSLLEDK